MEEKKARAYTSILLRGKLSSAVQWITDRERGSIFQMVDTHKNTWETVLPVLLSKHPEARPETAAILYIYEAPPPEMVQLDVTAETVSDAGRWISGGSGPGGTNMVSLQHWILRYRDARVELIHIVGKTTDWLSNSCPPWAAYWDLMDDRIIGINKNP